MALSRRRFLGMAGGTAGLALGGGVAWSRLVEDHVRERRASPPTRPDRILVVIEMAGGNDGLNSLVPVAGTYHDLRPTLAVPDDRLVALTGRDDLALHPSLAPLVPVWDAGRLAAIQGIGFGGQTRSHFAATDVWRAGGVFPFATSWLGRWLDETGGEDASPLRAIALGANTRVLAAEHSLSTVVNAPESFGLLAPEGAAAEADAVLAAFEATAGPVSAEPVFAAAQRAIPATLEAVDVLTRATGTEGGARDTSATGRATALLDTVARIIGLDVGAQVFVVGFGDFDTHAGQDERHPALLTDLAEGLTSFLDAVTAMGREQDVLVLTTSEFGRRVAENASRGTDHGNGNVQLLAGAGVQGQVVGAPDLVNLVEGDLPVDIETRSLYAVGLDWLGGPTDEILDGTFDRYDLLAR
jgi:uncharacterized protein (DUF1501 family)